MEGRPCRRLARLRHHLSPSPYAASSALTTVRVGFFGAGRHVRDPPRRPHPTPRPCPPEPAPVLTSGPAGEQASAAHFPSLRVLPGVEIVAIADSNAQLAQEKAAEFAPAATIYTDAMEMLEKEQLDVLWSVVPAFTRAAGVEAAAAKKGIHIFTEKPQATVMRHAVEIAEAVREAGVLSTVGFRERYRPLFQEARSFLADKTITHARFQSIRVLPEPNPPPPGHEDDWHYVMAKAGGPMFDCEPHECRWHLGCILPRVPDNRVDRGLPRGGLYALCHRPRRGRGAGVLPPPGRVEQTAHGLVQLPVRVRGNLHLHVHLLAQARHADAGGAKLRNLL